MSSKDQPAETPADRLATFFNESQPRDAFDDPDIEEVALLLQRLEHFAQKSPRTYIVLRSIGRLEVLEQLLGEGFHDACFPVELRGLPDFLDPRIKASIVQNQRIILTKSKSTLLEKGRHCHFAPEDPLPFVVLSVIGSGSYGLVQKIESRVTFKQYALKTVTRRAAFGNPNKVVMKAILNEIQVMKGLSHKHIVDYVGSYTDKRSFGIVMDPIADQDLAAYMEQTSVTLDNRPTLRTFFGCLATALAFLHDNHIRHRDIKPQNILVLRSNVLFTDFGLARESMDTSSGPMLVTSRYCAPEVIAAEKRNEAADMWSLGCVFLEMMAALQGHNVEWLKGYYATIDSGSTHFHTNSAATTKLLADWAVHCTDSDAAPLRWIKSMLTPRRLDRPSAEQIATQATSSSMYCCDQCHDTDDTDSIGSVVADFLDELEHGGEPVTQDHGKAIAVVVKPRSIDALLESPEPESCTGLIKAADAYRGQVFGASLEICNRFAGVDTFFDSSTARKLRTKARVPVVVAQCCDMLSNSKSDSRQSYLDLLAETHALSLADHEHITKLKRSFATSPHFVDDREWKILPKARVYALKILQDYLTSLPEPLADRFVSTTITSFQIQAFAEAYHHMFAPNRHLLLYLLNTFGKLVTEAGDDTTGDESGRLLALGQTLQAIASRFHSVVFAFKDEQKQTLAEKLLSNLIMDARKGKTLNKWESQRVGVFGVRLEDLLEYADEDVSDRTFVLSGEDYPVSGRIPIVVARCCELILQCSKKDGRFYNDFRYVHKVNEDVVTRIKDTFNQAPAFGKDIQWGRRAADEAAAVLSEFLKHLPEPLMPSWSTKNSIDNRLWARGLANKSNLRRTAKYDVATDNFYGRDDHESALDEWTEGVVQLSEVRRSVLLYLLAFWASYIEIALTKKTSDKFEDRVHDLSEAFGPMLSPGGSKDLQNTKDMLKLLLTNATYILDSASGGHKKARRRQIEDAKMKQDAADRAAKAEADRAEREARIKADAEELKRQADEREKKKKEEAEAKARRKQEIAEEKRKNGYRARLGRTVDNMVVNAYVRLHGPLTPSQTSLPGPKESSSQPPQPPPKTTNFSRPQSQAPLLLPAPRNKNQASSSQSQIPPPRTSSKTTKRPREKKRSRPASVHTLDSMASYDEIIRTIDDLDRSRA